ncbi:MAG: chemotaxis protein CheW [gamma proteobacterium symbiont of Bathyaustriella thionipta]|nr:chemotaxis protein CheW [gamma proteobacterium symbiont of Bathyaustriella thionipta]MCU7949985.1 chemotaxis protein CheW [gamma proteobacterium symbiont of Bathyaustriella thionipta]MCU7951857.1 chemotaxis protein CheW [gamma proteobacterium symbiont of Bathyaustriella thionipta]MCU7956561.1 chemotaxis protein CheW [gamma proteobacterium symbiont of Bathyaustriella thionipta]MCU7967384.1 chemotaxis protein CheW [gamma proteobacterium symbiont of Bathyaustriella thionipta]
MNLPPQNPQQIIQLLRQMEVYSQNNAAPLPLEEDMKSMWSGIGFRIADHHFVAPMEFVREIMKYPAVSQVPGSKEWVRGIANIRGNLLPIFDLQGFLGKLLTPIKRETRVLSIAKDQLSAGLIVDEIYGMKYFDQTYFDPKMGHDVKWQKFYRGGYQLEGKNWVIFNMQQLVESRDFLNVAN